MTLGDNQPPLTRRQARELARQASPVPVDDQPEDAVASVSDDGAAANNAAASNAAEDNAAETAAETTTDAKPDGVAAVSTRTGSTAISRRELRSMLAARAAATQPTFPDDEPTQAVVIDPEDDGIDDAYEPDAVEMIEIEPDADADAVPAGAPKLNPPVGHWSVARDVDEDVTVSGQHQPLDQLMARGIAAGGMPTTTNALILPSIPQHTPGSGPMTSTGEVLVTGSIDLPRSLGSTGQHPNTFDSSEMDHMLDQLDDSAPTSSVAPVSASKAVSSHASTRGVMTPPKKQAVSIPTVLSVTGAVLGVGVLALFLGGPVFGIF